MLYLGFFPSPFIYLFNLPDYHSNLFSFKIRPQK
jgi:hypothetical protein